jgi:serine/threonine protein kinase
MIGRAVSHYRIVSQLGSGGMGVVYAAEDVRLGRSVALKFVPEDLAKDLQAVGRLHAEARAASALNHPHICTIYDIGEFEGRPFIVMELIKGQTLRDRLAAGSLKMSEVVEIGIQVADALDAAHSHGIIHRDIKPANLFITGRRHVKILDFGLAKLLPQPSTGDTTAHPVNDQLTAVGVTIGTASYMSPEQVSGDQLDGRTDLFSLGVVLYECATNNRPFVGKTPAVIFASILNRAPVAPSVHNADIPVRLQEVIMNCLEKDPELRYQEAASLRADLKRIKRDLETGHTGAADVTGTLSISPENSGPRMARSATTSVPVEQTSATRLSSSWFNSRILLLAAAIGLAWVAAVVMWPRMRSPRVAQSSAADSAVRTGLDEARANLAAKNYRAALGNAEEVLRTVPDHAEALRIRESARSMIVRFDEAIATTNRFIGAGDATGAAGALAIARTIDPAAPAIVDLSARIDQLNERTAQARRIPEQPLPPPAARRSASTDQSPRPTVKEQVPRPAPVAPAPPVPAQPAPAATASPAPAAAAPVGNPPPADIPLPRPTMPAAPMKPPEPVAAEPVAPQPAAESSAARGHEPNPVATPPSQESADDDAIRRVIATYARAIEGKDLALFRSVKPNLSPEEQRRIEEGFRSVASQRVIITILGIEHRGQEALVRLKRRDQIEAGGRVQSAESQQSMKLIRAAGGWVIREIGR